MTDQDHGRANALAWLQSIVEMVGALDANDRAAVADWSADRLREEAVRAIRESVLSVEVRTDWHEVGGSNQPNEYKILLTTGGPACQIVGDLDEYFQPESAVIQYQNWFTPWVDLVLDQAEEEALLAFARCFYFGD